jgi:hypothetical protein
VKKLLLALTILLAFALSGCEKETVSESRCGENGTWVSTTLTPSNEGYCSYEDVYYTKEEVDEMLQDYYVQYVYLDSIDDLCNTITYNGFRDSNDCAESLSWLFDNWEELSYYVDGGFTEDIEGFEEYVIELELRIEELESGDPS